MFGKQFRGEDEGFLSPLASSQVAYIPFTDGGGCLPSSCLATMLADCFGDKPVKHIVSSKALLPWDRTGRYVVLLDVHSPFLGKGVERGVVVGGCL